MGKLSKTFFAACDNNFVQHFCVLAASIYVHHPDANVYLLGVGVTADSKNQVIDTAAKFGKTATVIDVDKTWLEGLRSNKDWSVAAWARVFAGKLLPNNIDRALYLDCDVLLVDTVDELFELDLNGNCAAGLCDCHGDFIDNERRLALNLGPEGKYFNSGVLLMDLEKWREQSLGDKILQFGKDNASLLTHYDQCSINGALKGKILPIAARFNAQPDVMAFEPITPKIIHFASSKKPWLSSAENGGEIYRMFRKLTPCSPMDDLGILSKIRRFTKYWTRGETTRLRGFLGLRKITRNGEGRKIRFHNLKYFSNISPKIAKKIEMLKLH